MSRRATPTRWSSSAPPAIWPTRRSFPSLQAMVKRGHLNVPVIGVAKAGWESRPAQGAGQGQPREARRARPGGVRQALRPAALRGRRLQGSRHLPGHRKELGSAQRPAHYLAIPPVLFGLVVEQLGKSGCATGARVIVEKPFGTDLASARALNRILLGHLRRVVDLPHRPLPGQAAGAQHAVLPLRQRVPRAVLEPQPRRKRADHHGGGLRRPGPRRFYDQTGAIRDVVQNHLFQVLTNLAMEPPVAHRQRIDPRREGQGAQGDPAARPPSIWCAGSSAATARRTAWPPDSKVETFAALRLEIDSWRWQGVPFYIRAGKCLPVTCTEVVVRLRQPPTMYDGFDLQAELLPLPHQPRHRPSPSARTVMAPGRGDGGAVRRDGGEPASRRGRDGRLRAPAGRRHGGGRHPVRPRGLCRGGVAHRRSRCSRRARPCTSTSRAPGGRRRRTERDASRRLAEPRGDAESVAIEALTLPLGGSDSRDEL